jgi:hypothetical protein
MLVPANVSAASRSGQIDDRQPTRSRERISVRYTGKTVKTILCILLIACFVPAMSLADDESFSRVKVPDPKGKSVDAVLTFNDSKKALEIHPVKGSTIKIPYDQIDKFAYEYTKKHRVTEGTIATAAIGIGAVAMLTKSKSHWLEISYHEEDLPKTYALRMDKRNYIRILEAVKNHTGKDAEVLGNADKRRR